MSKEYFNDPSGSGLVLGHEITQTSEGFTEKFTLENEIGFAVVGGKSTMCIRQFTPPIDPEKEKRLARWAYIIGLTDRLPE